MALQVKIVNKSPFHLPQYGSEGASGMDLKANISENLSLSPMQRVLVPTGLFVELPEGFEAQVRPRSGLAIKQGITCLNTPGTIDSDYRGEIKIILINLSGEVQLIQPGDRIAQLVVQKFEKVSWIDATELNATHRNDGGFGSTGKN